MKRSLFLPAALAAAFSLPTQADILISEVLYDPPNSLDASLEWVELFNAGCDAIDLSTYTLQDNQGSLNLSGTIQPNSYLIFANKADAFITKYGFAPNLTGMTHALGNSGDRLVLKNNGIDVDTVAWENNLTGWAIAAVDITIYRINNTKPATNDNWAVSTADSPGTGPLIQDCTGGTSSSSAMSSSNVADVMSSSSSSIAASVASSNASSNAMSSSAASSSSVAITYSYDVYYAPTMGREGFELRTALHSIIKTGHIRLTYSQVWGALQYTDEDPDNTANVLLLYSGRSADKNDRDGQAGFDNDSWNREHVWAKSYGFPDEDQYAYTDIHHLRPEDKTVNSSRSNKAFDNGGLAEGEAPDTFTDNDSWEPRDPVKGDVARMLFYMDVRYEGTDGNTPDLVLVDNTVMATGDANIGKLCTLIEWNQQDPVNNLEMRRNNRIHERQGNRNPFIDNPDWALSLWGTFCGVTSSSSSGASSSVFSSNVSSISSSIAEAASSSSITPSSSSSSLPFSSSSSTSSVASSNSSSGGGSLDWLGLLLLLGLVRLRR
jgi:endonuclease I